MFSLFHFKVFLMYSLKAILSVSFSELQQVKQNAGENKVVVLFKLYYWLFAANINCLYRPGQVLSQTFLGGCRTIQVSLYLWYNLYNLYMWYCRFIREQKAKYNIVRTVKITEGIQNLVCISEYGFVWHTRAHTHTKYRQIKNENF